MLFCIIVFCERLTQAISGLVRDGLVEKVQDEYFIADPFFSRYIKRILMSPRTL